MMSDLPLQLDPAQLPALLQVPQLEQVRAQDLFALFAGETAVHAHLPHPTCQIDPRDETAVLYTPSRTARPHDNAAPPPPHPSPTPCPICQGRTTGIVDLAPLQDGFTFINKNMYPVVYPFATGPTEAGATAVAGLHFLQWTSSQHDHDWHNLSTSDRVTVLTRLAALENRLLFDPSSPFPITPDSPAHRPSRGYLSIIKNYGRLVGGSLAHGHQQMSYTHLRPPRFTQNWQFQQRHGESFAAFMLRQNPPHLLVRDYGAAVCLVPFFMKRPYALLLILKDTSRQYLTDLTPVEFTAVADGWRDAILALHTLMPQLGRELAYNLLTHNGPGAGLYFEVMPYTQEYGGFEQLGLWVCQMLPETAADHLRRAFPPG